MRFPISKRDISMVLAYYPARWLIRLLPYSIANRLAIVGGNIHYLLPTRMKKVTLRNMTQLLGKSKTSREIKRAVRRNFVARHQALLDYFFLYQINAENLSSYVGEIEGKENLDQAMALGKGTIVLIAHFGPYALAICSLSHMGYEMAHITSRVGPQVFDMKSRSLAERVFKTYRKEVQQRVESKRIGYHPGEAFKASLQYLHEGKILGVAIDGSLARRTVSVPFMGQSMRLPSGIAALGVRAQAPFVPAFPTFQPGLKRKLEILPPIIPPPDMEEKEAIHYVVAEFAKIMEAYIRKYPDQWFTWVRLETQNLENGQFEIWAKPFGNASHLFGF